MDLSRRDFLKVTGATLGAATLADLAIGSEAHAETPPLRIKSAKETPTICPYCSVGCGIIVHSEGGKVVNTEGDPDHPVNQGALCSKGSALYQVVNNPRRITKVMYRAPRSSAWEEKSWDWALDRIAAKMKAVRDETWIEKETVDGKDFAVRRTDALAFLGGAANNNEEAYLFSKMSRLLGAVHVEHQARI